MFRQITGTIGDMMRNFEDDVLQVKSALEKLGRFGFASQPEPHKYMTKELDGSIREYQRDRGLKIDGWLRPGGETERSLTREIQDKTTTRNIFLPTRDPSFLPPRYEFPTSTLPHFNKDKVAVALENYVTAKNQPQPAAPQTTHKLSAQNKPAEPYGPPAPSQQRKKIIINDRAVGFPIASNPDAKENKPWYEFPKLSQVKKYESSIEERAKKADVDPDLVKAIMYAETTHGYYDKVVDLVDMNKSILPMNIHTKYWKDLGFSRDDLRDPEKNIQVGVALLKRIKKQVPDGDIKKIATLYNNLNAEEVSDYGARVASIYKEKPWKRK
ncbi:MAG: hypothetical protein DYH13_06880 [Alphaproteobacteria bacterium PRO2]|nr:hypothetical protein [Alphaproteobacteria bacterium PRO2]